MSYKIEWDNTEKTVILQEYLPGATRDDLYHLAQASADRLKTVEHTVHLIIDERNIRLSLNASDLKFLEKLLPPNQGVAVIIVPARDLAYKVRFQEIGKLTAPKALSRPHFVLSLKEARTYLQEQFSVRYQ